MARKKITTDALRYYVPLYQRGLVKGDGLREVTLRNQSELALARIVDLMMPLFVSYVNRAVKDRDDTNVIMYAGLHGFKMGMGRFDTSKMKSSPTNYLMQWFSSYASKELATVETNYGIPPTRYRKFKKIAAVRHKLSDTLGRKVSDDEVYEFFQSGGADIVTPNGPKRKKNSHGSNRKITIEMIREQGDYEEGLMKHPFELSEDVLYGRSVE